MPYSAQQSTYAATLSFERARLLYDIKTIAYVEGDITTAEDEHGKHQIIDIAEDGNIDRVNSILSLGVSECKNLLQPYTREPMGEAVSFTNTPTAPSSYTVILDLPRTFDNTSIELLSKLIHEYLVCRVVVDWFSMTNITNISSADRWKLKLEDVKGKIQIAKNNKAGRIRRKIKPF